jgi:AcrR family transcriptional regulator
MTTVDVAEPGLRERKRLATRRAIQLAVVELVSERGLDGVTVDEISHAADISPRTFFNYFASKEEALLGDPPEPPTAEVIEAFVHAVPGTSLLDGLTELLVSANEQSMHDIELVNVRHGLMKKYPELFAMRMAMMRVFEDQMSDIVARRLLNDDPNLSQTPDLLADRAKLATLVGFATMRHAWTCWATREAGATLTDRLRESFDECKTLFAPVDA